MTDTASERPLRRLARYAAAHRGRVRLAILCSILKKIFDLAPPLLIGAAVDIVVAREDSFFADLGLVDVYAQLWVLAGITVVAWGLESAFEYAQALLWRDLAQTMQHTLRVDSYDHMQRLGLGFFQDQRTGGLMAILNDDVNQLERFLDVGADGLIETATSTVLISILFIGLEPEVAALALLPMPFIAWAALRFQRRVAPRYAAVRERAALVNSQLASNLAGITTIKSYTTEDHETQRIAALSDAYRTANRRAIKLSSAFAPLIRMIIVLGFVVTLVFGGVATLDGSLSAGTYSVMVFMTQRLLWPLTKLGSIIDLYQRAMASTRRIMDLLDTPIRIRSGGTAIDPTEVRGAIAFEDVSFTYPGRDQLFSGLSLRVAPEETVAFVGATGAGKSTLAKLLLRMVEPDAGRVTLDGHPLETLTLPSLRRAVGLVSQDVYLFHGTVAENIAYGRPDASPEEIAEAARAAEAHDFIAALPEGYDTLVGEYGHRLSGGQRQRISIARAILRDPPVLILDEATSSVDNETEAAIQRSLERITHDRVTILIAHRLSTVRNADRIFVLAEGTVTEVGTHAELLDAGGLYASLWRVQTGEFGPRATPGREGVAESRR